jgi:hypothetical protein
MIDHLIRFDTEDAAKVDPVVGKYWTEAWNGSCCIAGVSVYRVTGTETVDSEMGSYEREVRESFPGWYINIALNELSTELRDLPDNACRLIADRDAAERNENFIVYAAPDMTPGALAVARVEPTFAGSNYPFGGA